jgi:hypothetical protein
MQKIIKTCTRNKQYFNSENKYKKIAEDSRDEEEISQLKNNHRACLLSGH